MAYINIDIEDYIDEISTNDLIEELYRRRKAGQLSKEQGKLIDLIEADTPEWPPIKTVLDQQKQDWIIENWEKITP